MNKIDREATPITWFVALLAIALTAACGGGSGGQDPDPGNPNADSLPTVSGTINANGATNVFLNSKVGATFSEGMNPASLTTATLFLMQGATLIPGTVTYSGVSAVFSPSTILTPRTLYTVTVKGGAGGVKDLAGNAMANDFVWSWTTGTASDTILPTVSGTINRNGATNVPVNTRVGATFSEGMDPSTVGTATMFLLQAGNLVPGTVSYSGVSAVLSPSSNLAPGTVYTVTVRGGASGVKDLAGNAMAGDFVWSWTTAAFADTVAPMVIGTIHANGATNVAVNTKVGATFSEGMDPSTLTVRTLLLMQGGNPVPGTVSYSGVSALFIPSVNLAPLTLHTVTVKGGVSGVKDLAGNAMASDFVLSWTTGATADSGAPTVIAITVPDGTVNVPLNVQLGATFSEGMDPLTITNVTCTLTDTLTGRRTFASTVNFSGATLEFVLDDFGPTPAYLLLPNTNYTVTIKGGVGGVADLAGNPMASDFGWTFTTAAMAP